MKLILIFTNIMKKLQADKNGCNHILFRIDIYFSECFLAVEIPLKNILLRFIKLILIFMNIMKKKIQADANGCKYILFRIDIYFSDCFLAVEIDKIGHTERDIIFQEKRQKALEKILGFKFIRINTSNAKNAQDLDHEVGNVQAFIDKFKNKKIKRNQKNN